MRFLTRTLIGVFALGILFLALSPAPESADADRGVGVTLGRIDVNERLAPGGSFELPGLGVINTGSQPDDYEVAVTYSAEDGRKQPAADWFEFSPPRFSLEPGASRRVMIRLSLPTGAEAGDYFAYLEAHPVRNAEGVSIGVAAATKVSFTVREASWLDAHRARVNRWMDDNQLLVWAVASVLLGGLLYKCRWLFPWQIDIHRK